ncbi:Protein of unknown function [Cotesia congregata]|uniref:Uncharacterized protein n=1 Tax=Cotesia congregata TaxID=51543 RepID=A0A8J2HJT7_COTCN|nr:Protein of unknown function [Cotesia congregata]
MINDMRRSAIIKKTIALKLDTLIEEREEVRVFIRKLLGLALLPATDINKAFEWLINNHKEIFKELKELIRYWLKTVKPERFSCYRKVNRTNNNIESYHRVLRLKLGFASVNLGIHRNYDSDEVLKERIATLQELAKIEKTSLELNLEIRSPESNKITQKNEMIEYLWDLFDNGTLDINNFLQYIHNDDKIQQTRPSFSRFALTEFNGTISVALPTVEQLQFRLV